MKGGEKKQLNAFRLSLIWLSSGECHSCECTVVHYITMNDGIFTEHNRIYESNVSSSSDQHARLLPVPAHAHFLTVNALHDKLTIIYVF